MLEDWITFSLELYRYQLQDINFIFICGSQVTKGLKGTKKGPAKEGAELPFIWPAPCCHLQNQPGNKWKDNRKAFHWQNTLEQN